MRMTWQGCLCLYLMAVFLESSYNMLDRESLFLCMFGVVIITGGLF